MMKKIRSFKPIVAGLVAGCCIPGMVQSQVIEVLNLPSGSSQCEYSLVSGTGSKLTFTCKTSSTPSAGTLSLVPTGSQSIVAVTGSTTFVLRRSGATLNGGSASGVVTMSGGCGLTPTSGGTQTFADNQNGDRTYTVSAGTAASGTTCTASLSAVVNAATGTDSIAIGVTATPSSPSPSACSTYTGRTVAWPGAEFLLTPFGGTAPVAIEIDTTTYSQLTSAYRLSITPSLIGGTPIMQASISPCPGDFSAGTTYGAACFYYGFPPTYMSASVGKGSTAADVCSLPASQKFYLNVRPTKLDGTTGCRSTTGNCAVYVNLTR